MGEKSNIEQNEQDNMSKTMAYTYEKHNNQK